MGLLLGDKHYADCGFRGHFCLKLNLSHHSDLYLNSQLYHPCIQHQLRRVHHRINQGLKWRKEEKTKVFPSNVWRKQNQWRPLTEDKQLYRRVLPYQGRVLIGGVWGSHQQPAEIHAIWVQERSKSVTFRCRFFQLLEQENHPKFGWVRYSKNCPSWRNSAKKGLNLKLLYPSERLFRLYLSVWFEISVEWSGDWKVLNWQKWASENFIFGVCEEEVLDIRHKIALLQHLLLLALWRADENNVYMRDGLPFLLVYEG